MLFRDALTAAPEPAPEGPTTGASAQALTLRALYRSLTDDAVTSGAWADAWVELTIDIPAPWAGLAQARVISSVTSALLHNGAYERVRGVFIYEVE